MRPHLVGKHHQSVVRLSSQNTSDTLGSMTHRIESQKVVLTDAVRVTQVFEASFEDARFRVLRVERSSAQVCCTNLLERAHLVRNAKHDDSSSIIVIEIDSFRDFAASDRQQHCASPIVAGSTVVVESCTRLGRVRSLDEDELVFRNLVQDALRAFRSATSRCLHRHTHARAAHHFHPSGNDTFHVQV